MPMIPSSALASSPPKTDELPNSARARDANLDFLRAVAILIVLVFHVHQQWPARREWLIPYTALGQYGVDLFFVLSGWLIGGLYWRELQKFGDVENWRFLARRSIRTVPPYLAALIISWLGVKVFKGQAFDFGYLLFLQNYYHEIPFFLVSWSLCVEEHFYLALPVLMLGLRRQPGQRHLWLVALAVLPFCFRLVYANQVGTAPFGYVETATHLRFEGLAMGVWASCLFYNRPDLWQRLRQWCSWLWPIALLSFLWLVFMSPPLRYTVGYFLVALNFTILLVHLVGRPAVLGARFSFPIARCSYSVYLTHAFMLNVGAKVIAKTPQLPEFVHVLVMFSLIAIVGTLFFYLFENSSLILRDKLVSRRR